MNVIMAIKPYKYRGLWMFDDPDKGLKKELFISGADKILEALTDELQIENEFTVLFSAQPFPGFQTVLEKGLIQWGGCWYKFEDIEGWLCAALFRYFETAPDKIYVQIKGRSN